MLEGTLESFSLPDIFQLLAFTKKSGCLRLADGSARGYVYFRDGQVYYAVSSSGRLALGRRLVGAGVVATGELRAALADQREAAREGRGLRIGQVLVRAGAIDEDTLETFVREQIQDAVFDLMRWPSGSFSFDMGPDSGIDEAIELSMSVENLIMEGSRRLEEWDAVHRKIPSPDAVVAMAAVPGAEDVEVTLKAEEWRLLTLVDGRRTVGDLVEVSGQGEFHTCKVLYGMIGSGLLEVRDGDGAGPSPASALLAQHELLRELEGEVPAAASAERPVPTDAVEEPAPAGAVAEEPVPAPAVAEEPVPAAAAAEERAPAPVAAPSPSEPRLTTDPSIDEDLVRRLIDGVKGL
jgi:hypothetical protein